MYIPKAFREDDIKTLHTFMREYSFATLVTQQEGMPFASHLPFLLDAGQGPYGTLLARMVEEQAALYDLLKTLIQTHEAHFEKPWPFQLPDEYLQKMMQGIVGFEIHITRLEGKFKLSQNRTASEREKVIAALQNCPDTLSAGVAEL